MYAACPYSQDGEQLVGWIFWISGSCVYGWTHALSWSFGIISFCAWLGAQLPQAFENYINQSVEGLSWGFLGVWFIGDFTNFLGCILTHQLPFQTILAFYYVCIDVILGRQYMYYSKRSGPRTIHLEDEDQDMVTTSNHVEDQRHATAPFKPSSPSTPPPNSGPSQSSPVTIPNRAHRRANNFSLGSMITYSFLASFTRVNGIPIPTQAKVAIDTTTSTIAASSTSGVGTFFAWVCACMYLTSRVPQIIKNYKRKSTWGTTMVLFASALTGNVTYTLSILLSPNARGPLRWVFLRNELPYLIGSAGTVCFDMTIIFQRLYYGNCRPHLYNHPPAAEPFGPLIQAVAPQPTISSMSSSPKHSTSSDLATASSLSHHGNGLSSMRLHSGYNPDATDSTPLSLSLQSSYSD